MLKKSLFIFSLLLAIFLTGILASAQTGMVQIGEDDFVTGFLIISIISAIIPIIIGIVIGVLIYKDAVKKGKKETGIALALLIIFVSIILGFVGLIVAIVIAVIWLAIKEDNSRSYQSRPPRICPNCGRSIPFDAVMCPYCSKRF
jgi:vacuolar-type H+-ATPase subunit I/STV1